MATVYLAEDIKHHRQVAIKVLRAELAATLGPDRFLREIEIAAQLQHPHILPLYDSGEAAGFLYFVMPFVEGESLRAKVEREGELPIADAVRILRDVTDALAYAHEHGVVHRDIKPDNVLLSGRHAMVTDFGVAKAVHEATGRQQLTTAGVALGTPAYMSPEQAAADPNIDHRADIYAVGVLAYELLSGQPPFHGTSPQMILAAHMTDAPVPVTSRRAAVPPAMADIVMRCLEKKPADRWQSAEELLPKFEGLATPSVGMTPTETRPIESVRPARSRGFLAIAAVVAVAVIAAVTTIFWPAGATPLARDRVLVGIFENETGDPLQDPLGKVIADWLSRGLHETGLVEVVDERSAASEVEGTGTARLRRIAESIGAGLIVAGSYYKIGDSLQLQGQIMDANDGSIISAVGPITAPAATPQSAIVSLRQRTMGAFANILDPRFGAVAPGIQPPNYEAYREFVAGDEAFNQGRMQSAAESFERAYGLDSMFAIALVRGAYAYQSAGRCDKVDSINTVLAPRRSLLSPYERQYLDRIVARCSADFQTHLTAAEEMFRLAPKSSFAKYVAGRSALWVNRPQYGLTLMEELDPTQGEIRVNYHQVMRDIADAYHMLGDYDGELATVERWNRVDDDRGGQQRRVRALIALGRADEALESASLGGSMGGTPPFWPADLMCDAALELRVHGEPDLARSAVEECVDIIERLGPEAVDSIAYLGRLADGVYLLDRLEEAELLYRSLLELRPLRISAIGRLGVIAARTERADMAWEFATLLADGEWPANAGGVPTLLRAKILAALGERDAAVDLVRQAVGEGIVFLPSGNRSFHKDPDFDPLRGYAPFEEIVRPKG